MSVTVQKDTLLIRADDCLAADISKTETVILGADRKNYYGTNEVSSRIWKLMEQETSPAAITATLTQEYDVDESTCLDAVIKVLEDMARESLVQVRA